MGSSITRHVLVMHLLWGSFPIVRWFKWDVFSNLMHTYADALAAANILAKPGLKLAPPQTISLQRVAMAFVVTNRNEIRIDGRAHLALCDGRAHLNNLDGLFIKYKGQETQMYQKLCKKYYLNLNN